MLVLVEIGQERLFKRKTRKEKQDLERTGLSQLAFMSSESKGRTVDEEQDLYDTPFEVDVKRILSSNAYRRLNGKTQVFTLPRFYDVRNRLIHTQNVARLSTKVARELGLNEDLSAAIAYGHDVGHPPGGHKGERILSKILGRPFRHQENSVVMLNKEGLNLTYEVLDGILKHSCGMERVNSCELPETKEGLVVVYVDKGEYIFHDIEEACRAGIISMDNLPLSSLKTFGRKLPERIENYIESLIDASLGSSNIKLPDEVYGVFEELREFMYKYVYRDIRIATEEDKFGRGLLELYERLPYMEAFYYLDTNNKEEITFALSCLTDTEALSYINDFRSPNSLV